MKYRGYIISKDYSKLWNLLTTDLFTTKEDKEIIPVAFAEWTNETVRLQLDFYVIQPLYIGGNDKPLVSPFCLLNGWYFKEFHDEIEKLSYKTEKHFIKFCEKYNIVFIDPDSQKEV